MASEFITTNPWAVLTAAAKRSAGHVAVAYFGAGAAKLLPLRSGSVLVVDASERAVKSGQTSPADLLALIKKGVRIHSIGNLHAKVFVFDGIGFAGSTNVSHTSAESLVEAMIQTTQPAMLAKMRTFVDELAVEPIGPEYAKKLLGLYNPPKMGRGRRGARRSTKVVPRHERLTVLRMLVEPWSDDEKAVEEAGKSKARDKIRKSFAMDTYLASGGRHEKVGEHILQVTDCEDGTVRVSPPGRIVHLERSPRLGRRPMVVLELLARRRKSLEVVGRQLGEAVERRLRRQGPLNAAMTRQILSIW
jgi:hypothetical protein